MPLYLRLFSEFWYLKTRFFAFGAVFYWILTELFFCTFLRLRVKNYFCQVAASFELFRDQECLFMWLHGTISSPNFSSCAISISKSFNWSSRFLFSQSKSCRNCWFAVFWYRMFKWGSGKIHLWEVLWHCILFNSTKSLRLRRKTIDFEFVDS